MAIKVYISAKMSGCENYNFGTFDNAAHELASNGFFFANPANIARDIFYLIDRGKMKMPNRHGFMRYDIRELSTCDAMYLIKPWDKSWGAKWERIIAKYVFDIPVFESISDLIAWRDTLVDESENNK